MPFVTTLLCVVTAIVTHLAMRDRSLSERLLFRPESILAHKQWYRLFSHALIHADWLHCIFNLIALILFAEHLEYVYGGGTVLAIYLTAILGGGLLSLYLHRHHAYESVGASAGVCGIVFASLFLMPGSGIGFFFLPIFIPGWIYAVLFLFGAYVAARRNLGTTAHEAHFGGAVVGLLAALAIEPQSCLAQPLQYFGVLTLAFVALAALVKNPLGLDQSIVPFRRENYRSNVRYQHYDDAQRRTAQKAEIDRLLDRVAAKGYDNLTPRERERLKELAELRKR